MNGHKKSKITILIDPHTDSRVMSRDRDRDRDRARRHAHRDRRDRRRASTSPAVPRIALPSVDISAATDALKNLPLAPTLLLLGAVAVGRRALDVARRIVFAKKKSRTLDDAIDELMRQPYMREIGTPSPGKGGLRRALRDARVAVFGETKAERTSRAIDLEAKLNDACADFSMLESSVGTSVDAALLESDSMTSAMFRETTVDELLLDVGVGLLNDAETEAMGTMSTIGVDAEWVLDQSVADTTLDDLDVGDVGGDFAARESALGPRVERTSSKLEI